MIKVIVGTNLKKTTKIVSSSATLRQVLEDAGVDYTRGGVNLDGATVGLGDLDKSFEQLGITEKCYLMQVVKADNA